MILVTGGTGFIGSHVLEKLSSSGVPARCLLRPRNRPATLPAGIEPAFGDLSTGHGLAEALRGITALIHLAGVTKALRKEEFYSGNVRATETLLHAVAGREIRLVHVSSLAAIGPSRDGTPVGEDDPPGPITHYGKSKLEAERLVRKLTPQAVIVRPPVVYGPRDTDVFQLLKSISQGLVLEIAGGERWFSAIYVTDLVDGLLAAANCPRATGRTYFLAHPKPNTWTDLSSTAARIMACRPSVLRAPVPVAYSLGFAAEIWSRITRKPGIVSREKIREARCRWWMCDTRRAAAELGFQATTPLDTGLSLALAWYKEAGWLKW
ncbi:MAG TPA: NAD-dependent epimerase/dehydratase family protein [Bryobacteraceae bacterium]|nr:NAD-dependent epimerase/dehydratase family protein [Bryobacteraceae bacterium]